MRTSTAVVTIVAIIVIAGGTWWLLGPNAAVASSNNQTATTTQATSTDTGTGTTTASTTAPMTATVHYNGTSFSPQAVTIAKGGTVTWVNDSSNRMWVASASHPTHTVYDGTTEEAHCAAGYTGPKPFDQCTSSASYSFTFDKTGKFNFHNHANASAFGSVTVQ